MLFRSALFTTRWAMSYLRGPLTREQIGTLMAGRYTPSPAVEPAPAPAAVPAAAPAPATAEPTPAPAAAPAPVTAEPAPAPAPAEATTAAPPADVPPPPAPVPAGTVAASVPTPAPSPATEPVADEDVVPVAPKVADGVAVRWLDPAAPWIAQVPGALATSTKLAPSLIARVSLLFDDVKLDLRHTEEWEAVYCPLPATFDPAQAIAVDHDERDLRTDPPAGAGYVLSDAPIDEKAFFTRAEKAIVDHLYRSETQQVPYNRQLKLAGRVDESPQDFVARCRAAADEAADQDQVKLQKRFAARIDKAQAAVATASDRAAQAQAAESTRKTSAIVSGAGALLGAVLGGKRSARTMARDLGTALGSQGRSTEASTRTDSAMNNMARKQAALADLEQDLATELAEIDATWTEKAAAVDTVEVSLKRSDIRVTALALAWLPVT